MVIHDISNVSFETQCLPIFPNQVAMSRSSVECQKCPSVLNFSKKIPWLCPIAPPGALPLDPIGGYVPNLHTGGGGLPLALWMLGGNLKLNSIGQTIVQDALRCLVCCEWIKALQCPTKRSQLESRYIQNLDNFKIHLGNFLEAIPDNLLSVQCLSTACLLSIYCLSTVESSTPWNKLGYRCRLDVEN